MLSWYFQHTCNPFSFLLPVTARLIYWQVLPKNCLTLRNWRGIQSNTTQGKLARAGPFQSKRKSLDPSKKVAIPKKIFRWIPSSTWYTVIFAAQQRRTRIKVKKSRTDNFLWKCIREPHFDKRIISYPPGTRTRTGSAFECPKPFIIASSLNGFFPVKAAMLA